MRSTLILLCCAGALTPAAALTLYDAGLGSRPSAQGWTPLRDGAAATQDVAGGVYTLDTRGSGVSIFGNALRSPTALDTDAGFVLDFGLRIAAETHTSVNRGGYSVLFVGADNTRALELAFWTGHVFAYDYDPADPDRFVHGADVAIDTTATHAWRIGVAADAWTLSADGAPLLGGALHDYSADGAPYTLRNFVFFGDDTSRGTSVSALSFVALAPLAPVSEPASALLLLAGLAPLQAGWRRRRRA